MERTRRKIILTGNRFDPKRFTLDGFQLVNNEYLIFDPIELFKELDWTSYENSVQVINQIYSKLFNDFVLENKIMVCYWPTTNFPDNQWFELLSHIKKAGITMEANYLIAEGIDNEELPTLLQATWKDLVLEMLESISEDIILNEQLEEIVQLRNGQYSISIFSQVQNDHISYFYISSAQEVLEFAPQYEFEKTRDSRYVELFLSFELLLEAIQTNVELSDFTVEFLDHSFEKIYFNSIFKKKVDFNLIEHWVENYSLN